MNTKRLQLEEYRKGILEGDRVILAQAITLMESTLADDQILAEQVLESILPKTGNSLRIGITGSPGVGKSTFIEAFGNTLLQSGKAVAVLAIDPSSRVTGGSILGDKTRMTELAKHPQAFIRPSPSAQTLGGVATHTRETILLCEAAGFEYILIETVGTGQSEIAVRNMVDFFLLLMQPGSGDELQGIKKGIVEMADAIAITKADGEYLKAARATQADFQQALHLSAPQPSGWTPRVVTCSALTDNGLTAIRDMIEEFRATLTATGAFKSNRRNQNITWFNDHFSYLLSKDPQQFATVTEAESMIKEQIQSGNLSPRKASKRLLQIYHDAIRKSGLG